MLKFRKFYPKCPLQITKKDFVHISQHQNRQIEKSPTSSDSSFSRPKKEKLSQGCEVHVPFSVFRGLFDVFPGGECLTSQNVSTVRGGCCETASDSFYV